MSIHESPFFIYTESRNFARDRMEIEVFRAYEPKITYEREDNFVENPLWVQEKIYLPRRSLLSPIRTTILVSKLPTMVQVQPQPWSIAILVSEKILRWYTILEERDYFQCWTSFGPLRNRIWQQFLENNGLGFTTQL